MKKLILPAFLIFLSAQVFAQLSSLEKKLFELPDVIFAPIAAPEGFEASYELAVRQPVDHQNPENGYFYQRVFLSHKGYDKPVVFVTEGYEQQGIYPNELTDLLEANQIEVEHRYFGKSVPEHMEFEFLNVQQEAADLHYINTIMKKIYKGKWISTGISKGGQNSIFYRYLYPEDVDVTVPYVAPLNLDLGDKRIYTFFDTVNTAECRNKIMEFQIRMLKDRNQVLPLIKFYSKGKNLNFTYLSIEQAFEYTVLEYAFSFWQWGHHCNEIPSANSSVEEALEHLLYVSDIEFFADETMEKFESHYYQAARELGYYSYKTDEFKGLLLSLQYEPYPSAIFTPNKMEVKYNSSISKDVYNWTQKDGDNIIYIYGASDTWSATSVPVSEKTNSLWFFLNGAHHGSARIKNMTPSQRLLFVNTLENWLNIELE